MCIIVDPPLFIPMFKSDNPEHAKYLPVKLWVDKGQGKFVFGGDKYLEELHAIKSILTILAEYERRGLVKRISKETVNTEMSEAKRIEPRPDFDDPHLVALVRATGCKLICVNDPRSHKYLRAGKFYSSLKLRPSLYTRAKNANLLCPANIAACCK